MFQAIHKFWKLFFPNKERVIDAIIDLSIDIILIIIEVMATPIVLPLKIVAHGFKIFTKTYLIRQGRKATKSTIKSRT